jgi:hypothetical protein
MEISLFVEKIFCPQKCKSDHKRLVFEHKNMSFLAQVSQETFLKTFVPQESTLFSEISVLPHKTRKIFHKKTYISTRSFE